MTAVIVSPDFEIVIPENVCRAFKIVPGQKLVFLTYNNQIVLVPARSIEEARGAFPDLDTTIEDEPDREL